MLSYRPRRYGRAIWLRGLLAGYCDFEKLYWFETKLGVFDDDGLVGKVSSKYVDDIEREDADLSKPLHPSTVESVPQIGFWLPQSGDRLPVGRRYQKIKTSFEDFLGKGSWGIDDLIQDSSDVHSTSTRIHRH